MNRKLVLFFVFVLLVAAIGPILPQVDSQTVHASTVIHPIEYMINTSGYTFRDQNTGDIQKTIVNGNTFWYMKNPGDGTRWERYRYDESYIWLERDTTWPSGTTNTAYDMAPWTSGKWAPTYNWTVGTSFQTTTTVVGFNHKSANGTTCSYTSNPQTYEWPMTKKLVYHNSAYHMGGDLGTVDVIVIETTTTSSDTNPYIPKNAERHWYAKGKGFVKWQNWSNYQADPNFANVTGSNPDQTVTLNRSNGSAPSFQDVCASLKPAGTAEYSAHQENYGWLDWVYQGQTGGIDASALRMEALKLKVTGMNVQYRAYVEGTGWQSWVTNGAVAGTTAQSKRIEGLQIQLVSPPAGYDIQYRAHVQNYGWMSWQSNGTTAGIPGSGLRVEAVQIRVIKS